MSNFFGFKPRPKTSRIADDFENKIIIRRNNRSLIPKVYADIEDDEWKVAVGYNQTRIPDLHAKENDFEVLYRYAPSHESTVVRLGTDTGCKTDYPAASFSSPDDFIIWAIGQEKENQLSPA